MSVLFSLQRQLFFKLNLALAKARCSMAKTTPASEQGLTILECLIAIAVIIVTISVLTPPLLIATATRVQNKQTEQALQLAQGQIDRIRVLVERSSHYPSNLPAVTSAAKLQDQIAPATVAALLKSNNSNCPSLYTTQQVSAEQALPVDVDGDCKADFLLQTFRTPGNITPTEQQRAGQNGLGSRPSNFAVGVRVYSYLAAGTPPTGSLNGLSVQPSSLQLTNSEGHRRTQPLAVIYTPFSWSDQSGSLCDYQSTAVQNTLAGCASR
jgi:type II secretory pathway pseudopilin PulG